MYISAARGVQPRVGVRQAGVPKPAKASLAAEGFCVTGFDDVVTDPPEAMLPDCVALCREAF